MKQNDCIYAAGFMDGEGCITTAAANFRVTISSTDKCILDWFVATFGGTINNMHMPANPKWNMSWKWIVASKSDVATFLKSVYPYLKLKKPQAKVVLDFLEKHQLPPSKSERKQRSDDYNIARASLPPLRTSSPVSLPSQQAKKSAKNPSPPLSNKRSPPQSKARPSRGSL